jgi:nitrogen fixation NifU-like protein
MDLYQEEILDHYKHPRNKKRVDTPSFSAEAVNPLCGDKLSMEIRVKDGIIEDIGFWGEGCAISQAAMSMVTEEVKGQPVAVLRNLTQAQILDLLGVPVGPSRLKCALLCLSVAHKLS